MSVPRLETMLPGISAASYYILNAPFNGQPIAEVPVVGVEGIEQALQTAHGLFRNRGGWLPLHERIAILEKAASLMQERAEPLALEAAREGGKPLMDSRVEVARAIDSLRGCVVALRSDQGEVIPMRLNKASAGRLAFTQTEPIGVVVAISAFNHPVNLIVHQVGPAIAAGCPVIVKPARTTPGSCWRVVEILREAGLPEAWCQPLMPQDNSLTTRLATDPRVAFLSFIGSGSVGWALRSKLAPGTRCALEHGGVAPVIVAADADLDVAIPLIAKGGYYHAGQVCVSVQRVFVAKKALAAVSGRLAAAASQLKVGDPTLADTEVGPLITAADTTRVGVWIGEAVAGGGLLACGGQALSPTSYAPSLLIDPPEGVRVSTQEVFGPLVCLYGYDEMDEAIQRANALDVAFQAAVFTRNIDTALRCFQRLDASAVMVNDHTAFRVDWMPFAGLRHSGYNVGGIPHTLHDMQVRKMMVMKSAQL